MDENAQPSSRESLPSLDSALILDLLDPFSPKDVELEGRAPVVMGYELIEVIGRGGMGLVYRARQLSLNRIVALKVMLAGAHAGTAHLARFWAETQALAQLNHPNIVHVYEVGGAGGLPYFSMEYVDKGSLQKEIHDKPPPLDRAVELVETLARAVDHAHELGIIHRDLKPANVLLTSKDVPKIADFGLAKQVQKESGVTRTGEILGTPSYMAPEQALGNKQLTIAVDIYALGAILYELLTGRPPFEAATAQETFQKVIRLQPVSPQERNTDVPQDLEVICLKCLEKEPTQRYKSAKALAEDLERFRHDKQILAWPSADRRGGAGKGTLRPAVALALLTGIALGIFCLLFLAQSVRLIHRVPFNKSPDVLTSRAQAILVQLGYPELPLDSASKFFINHEYLKWVKENDSSPTRWERLARGQPPAIYFWYRQSPRYLDPTRLSVSNFFGEVTPTNPPPLVPGMASVTLDGNGNLWEFEVVPELKDDGSPHGQPDWKALFTASGLDLSRFQSTESRWAPPAYADARRAWIGFAPEQPNIELRVEAASHHSKPISFRILGPWKQPSRDHQDYFWGGADIAFADVVYFIILVVALVGGGVMAWWNWRDRADVRGASELAVAYAGCKIIFGFLRVDHVCSLDVEISLFQGVLGQAVLPTLTLWLSYLAVEPYARRRWKWRIAGWNCVLNGRFCDPLVGRSLLIGGLAGVVTALVMEVQHLAAPLLGAGAPIPLVFDFDGLNRRWLTPCEPIQDALLTIPLWFFLLFLAHVVCRVKWLAVGLIFALAMGNFGFGNGLYDKNFVYYMAAGLAIILSLWVTLKYGLLAMVFYCLFYYILLTALLTTDVSAWYIDSTTFYLLVLFGVAGCGFAISLRRRPLI